jgi:DNA-binding transcriptional LysR family regulator
MPALLYLVMRSSYDPSQTIMTLDLRLIRYAHAIAANRSFNRAATALGIAQPTLSRSIRQLEQELGLPLFTRNAQGAEPTDFGLVFLKEAELVVAQVADLEKQVALVKGLESGTVALGVGPYVAEVVVPRCLGRISAAHPAVGLRIQLDAPDALGRALRARSVDLAVAEASMLEEDEALEVVARLAPMRGYVLVRARHPLVSRADVTMADVLDFPLVQIARMPPRALTQLLRCRRKTSVSAGTAFPAIECPTVPLGLHAVLDSDATVMAALSMAQGELEAGLVRPLLHEPWMCSNWAIVKLRRRTLAPAAKVMIEALERAHDEALARDLALCRVWDRRLKSGPAIGGGARRAAIGGRTGSGSGSQR